MQIEVNGIWYTPSVWYNVGFYLEGPSGREKVPIEVGDTIRTDLPSLYKKRDGGTMMQFSWHLWRDKEGFNIVGTITEDGRKDRTYTSVAPQSTKQFLICSALEAMRSKWQKKQDRDGWTQAGAPEPLKEPMLLHKWDDAKKKEGPWLVSPKLDGIRGTYNVRMHQLISRKRNPFALSHICAQLQELGIGADGELWHPEHDWETISSTVSRDLDQGTEPLLKRDLQFHIFDRDDMPDVPYVERLASLIDLDLDKYPNLFIVPSIYCQNEDEVQRVFKQLVDAKYEGAVARTLTGLYKNDNRSWDVLKIKPLHSKEFLLRAITFDTDPSWGQLISYVLVADNGSTFKATPAKSKEERSKDYLKLRDMPILEDVWITVEYRDTYSSGIPKFSVVKGIRNMGI